MYFSMAFCLIGVTNSPPVQYITVDTRFSHIKIYQYFFAVHCQSMQHNTPWHHDIWWTQVLHHLPKDKAHMPIPISTTGNIWLTNFSSVLNHTWLMLTALPTNGTKFYDDQSSRRPYSRTSTMVELSITIPNMTSCSPHGPQHTAYAAWAGTHPMIIWSYQWYSTDPTQIILIPSSICPHNQHTRQIPSMTTIASTLLTFCI